MSRIRIVLAERNPQMRETLLDLLSPDHDIVATVGNGSAAIEKTLAFHPDIVVLNVEMADISGFEVTRRLRQMGSKAKFVYCSMQEADEFVEAGFRSGASAYVFKSAAHSDLVTAIRDVSRGGTFRPLPGIPVKNLPHVG